MLPGTPGRETQNQGSWVQLQRMANPLFNELIIGTGSKDKFSMSEPKDDAQFARLALDPLLARVMTAVYGIPVPDSPRTDLLPLVQYVPPIAAAGTTAGPVADLLRLNTGVAPTAASARKRMGLLAGDGAGFPNGRRVFDDVTDIAARAVAGILAGGVFAGFPYNRIGDGSTTNLTWKPSPTWDTPGMDGIAGTSIPVNRAVALSTRVRPQTFNLCSLPEGTQVV